MKRNYIEILNDYIREELKYKIDNIQNNFILKDEEINEIEKKVIEKIEKNIGYMDFLKKLTGILNVKGFIIEGFNYEDMNYYFVFALQNYIKFFYKNLVIEIIKQDKIKDKELLKKILIEVLKVKLSIKESDDNIINKEVEKIKKMKLSYAFISQLKTYIKTELRSTYQDEYNTKYSDLENENFTG